MDEILAAVIATIGASALTALGSYVKWIYPRRKSEEAAERVRLEVWNGREAIPGAAPEIVAMPLRVEGVEKGLVQVRDAVDALTERQNAANGTASRIERKVDDLIAKGIVTKADLLETAQELAARTLAQQTTLIAAIQEAAEASTTNTATIIERMDASGD